MKGREGGLAPALISGVGSGVNAKSGGKPTFPTSHSLTSLKGWGILISSFISLLSRVQASVRTRDGCHCQR